MTLHTPIHLATQADKLDAILCRCGAPTNNGDELCGSCIAEHREERRRAAVRSAAESIAAFSRTSTAFGPGFGSREHTADVRWARSIQS